MSKLVPKLRFKEFSGEWEEKRLGDIGKISMCKRILKKQTTVKGDIPFYKIGTFGKEADAYIDKKIYEEFKEKYSFPKIGDILISASGTIGRLVIYNGEPAYFQDSNIVWIDNNEKIVKNSFLYYSYKNVHWNTNDNTISRLYNDNLRSIKICIPKSPKEQQKIASCLSSLDNFIEATEKKVEALKKHKKGLMQQLFPKEGIKEPTVRFNGFSGEWEEKNINELANRYDNLRIPITASDRKKGVTPYYGANGIQDYVDGYTHDGEFILVAEDGANDLKNYPVQYVNGKIWVNNHAHVLQSKIGISNNIFLMYAIKNINIEPYLVGGGRAKLNANIMMKINIQIPTQKEQQKIASCLSSLDNLIEATQNKLKTLKKHKKGLMQQLFVSSEMS